LNLFFLDKTEEEINFLVGTMKYFRSRAERLGAEEVQNDMAAQLLNDAKQLYKKTKADKKHQIELMRADKQIFKVKISYVYIIHCIY
jgi:hypothetical protein